MTDETAVAARLMKVVEVMVAELDRQRVAEALASRGFDPTPWPRRSSRQRTAM
jgi:hypothetical protein